MLKLSLKIVPLALLAGLVFSIFAEAYAGSGPSWSGARGLNTVPTARMARAGTVELSVSTLDPYVQSSVSIQPLESVAVALRQTARTRGSFGSADRWYPGMDFKIRLLEEGWRNPEIAIGVNAATGHERMAGEYIALSKRLGFFDLTAGLGWGRMGQAGHLRNPLTALHSHFDRERSQAGEGYSGPEDWFTGKRVGFFGGLAYRTPVEGLTVLADWNADRYDVERAQDPGFDAPAPVSVGLSWSPYRWLNVAAGASGTRKIMGRMTLSGSLQDWRVSSYKRPAYLKGRTPFLYATRDETLYRSARLELDPGIPVPLQLGRARERLLRATGPVHDTEFRFTPTHLGLHGPELRLVGVSDFAHRSSQELWRDLVVRNGRSGPPPRQVLPVFRLDQVNHVSIGEPDTGILYRSSLIGSAHKRLAGDIVAGGAVRVNLSDNLRNLQQERSVPVLPVRSDVALFADSTVSLDRAYTAWIRTLAPNLHAAAVSGILEEMYAGFGGEVLYRPWDRTWSAGLELYQVFRRDPYSPAAMDLSGDSLLTGHAALYYEVPDTGLTFSVKAGRYLAEDIGLTLAAKKRLENGVAFETFVTATQSSEETGLSGDAWGGLRVRVPVGFIPVVPNDSSVILDVSPMGRDRGQALDSPVSLYALSESFSKRTILRDWNRISE